jgi:hypothetical protein
MKSEMGFQVWFLAFICSFICSYIRSFIHSFVAREKDEGYLLSIEEGNMWDSSSNTGEAETITESKEGW